mmetsp:Transcript_166366/g.528560  ORF Transcript_166366/g.528560 Transcript_166366/m.528560 type:complete len:217 (-) Transcript_166366:953-1603(-)
MSSPGTPCHTFRLMPKGSDSPQSQEELLVQLSMPRHFIITQGWLGFRARQMTYSPNPAELLLGGPCGTPIEYVSKKWPPADCGFAKPGQVGMLQENSPQGLVPASLRHAIMIWSLAPGRKKPRKRMRHSTPNAQLVAGDCGTSSKPPNERTLRLPRSATSSTPLCSSRAMPSGPSNWCKPSPPMGWPFPSSRGQQHSPATVTPTRSPNWSAYLSTR